MTPVSNLCMGCMREKLYKGPCEICGYDENNEIQDKSCLAVGTILANRYLIGRLLSKNGEGCVYIALDTSENRAVEIKEFMPDALCTRTGEDGSIEVLEGSLPLYKSYLSEFSDLHKTLMSSPDIGCLRRVYGIFASGNTGYVVMEHPEGITLEEYLKEHGGKIKWEKARDILLPLFDTVSAIHSKGIVHRGISPKTILINSRNGITLTSLGISAVRSADSMINCEMYEGYAACEQYTLSERQGSWTDVYGLSAVLYRVLTGTQPPDAKERESSDSLVAPALIDEEIPAYVSDAVKDGMDPNWNERIHTVKQLYERLYEPGKEEPVPPPELPLEEEDDGPITPMVAPEIRHVQEARHQEHTKQKMTVKEKKKKERDKANLGVAVGLTVFFVLVIGLGAAILYFSDETRRINDSIITAQTTEEPEETAPPVTTAATTVPVTTADTRERLMMPNFVNRFFNSQLENRYMLNFETEYEFMDEAPKGIIFEQDISENTLVPAGTTVKIKISNGPESIELPPFNGYRFSEYASKLNELGIKYISEERETSEANPGYVVACSKSPGEKVMLSEDEVITVYYAITPSVTETSPEETQPAETQPQTESTEAPQQSEEEDEEEPEDEEGPIPGEE